MAEPLLLAQYHDAVIGALKKIEWVRDADAYPEKNVPRFSGWPRPLSGSPLTAGSRAGETKGN
ncbi:hypothetical protein [Citrobacter koseri]|uniref:hypothetical protein n=1 Tax=Citrobacter koseri TaxID=545 RepID=UPI000D9062B6|nr:hypothetical protein [Citrobacter koseri]SQB66371.1 Uncharacterised protein [Citrobacter koseri]